MRDWIVRFEGLRVDLDDQHRATAIRAVWQIYPARPAPLWPYKRRRRTRR